MSKIAQVFLSLFIMLLVTVQTRGGGLSSAFGGREVFYRSKRGLERVIFVLTAVFGVLLVANSILLLFSK
ncbi:preprotein translocase subunit SecG [candidate division WWE3 bacterium]|nr:preprotein translocase subunit SecG [candidate division WWE3 bacterium]